MARAFLRGTSCTACMRVFGSRRKLLHHVHKKPAKSSSSSSSSSSGSRICLANILLKLATLPEEEVEQEDWAQRATEAEMRKKGLSKDSSGTLVRQAYGPLIRTMVIPKGHSRRSRSALFKKALKCLETANKVDFDRLLVIFDAANDAEEILEDVPLDILAASL